MGAGSCAAWAGATKGGCKAIGQAIPSLVTPSSRSSPFCGRSRENEIRAVVQALPAQPPLSAHGHPRAALPRAAQTKLPNFPFPDFCNSKILLFLLEKQKLCFKKKKAKKFKYVLGFDPPEGLERKLPKRCRLVLQPGLRRAGPHLQHS